ncbi:hypothetical protein [Actinotalea sp. JY-7876]|uniref:hypothetical protein n=1 Tax=Actinotalea sp. JY-7876 TaxID=2758442 RepID=UPI0015F7733B|nr:hypothetical protein [Actinotalea sp. JY-7876]
MRTGPQRRATAGRLAAVVAILSLAGCAQERWEVPATGPGEVWFVGMAYPEGDWTPCVDDDSVAESHMTADMPTSRAAATFTPEADEDDVRRVLDCLDRSLTGGDVSVGVTAQRDDAG